jgi:hypothetical protein
MLSPLELGVRLDRILGCAETLVASLPIRTLDHELPQGGGSVRDLGFRVFRLSLAYVDGMDMSELPRAWLREAAPPDLIDGGAVARYGALVRGRIAGWFEGAGPGEYGRTITTSNGPENGHALLERTTVSAAQHLRRLHAVAVELGSTPRDPLPDFEGLPLPASLW